MKRFIYAILFVLILVILLVRNVKPSEKSFHNSSQKVPVPTQTSINSIEIQYNNRTYKLIYEQVTDKKILFVPNFTEKQTASSLVEKNSCMIASSGGFYTKQNTPLGLYKKNGQQISRRIASSNLLTGYLFETDTGTVGISNEPPPDASNILQAGPFFENGKTYPTKQDEYTRRIVIIEDTNDTYYVGAVIGDENTFSGPMLSELPSVLFSIKSPFVVNRVLNLDGGNASYFLAKSGYALSELTAVGSILCFK